MESIILITALLLKHTVADYFMQYGWMLKDKASYGAFGGLMHAGWHGALTLLVLLLATDIPTVYMLLLSGLDTVLHYHIDYLKSNLWKKKAYQPYEQQYWMIHGADQFAHILTYGLIAILVL